jgi:hypothetical protein
MLMRKILTLLLVMLLVGLRQLDAQTPAVESPASGRLPEWAADSQTFVYQNVSKSFSDVTPTYSEVFMEAPYWESFNPNTHVWHESNVWPLYPNLSAAEQQIFQTTGFIRASPDGQLLAYPSLNEKLTIANRNTHEIYVTDIDFIQADRAPVKWSEDSRGLAVESTVNNPYSYIPLVYYLRITDLLNLKQTQIYKVSDRNQLAIGDRRFLPVLSNRVLDVHQNSVLTIMSDLTDFGNADLGDIYAQPYLVIWTPENPQESRIINAFYGDSIKAAAVSLNNPKQLFLISVNHRFMQTSPQTPLHSVERLKSASFSPSPCDGEGAGG